MEKVVRDEIVETMQKMKPGKATGPSEVRMEMIRSFKFQVANIRL